MKPFPRGALAALWLTGCAHAPAPTVFAPVARVALPVRVTVTSLVKGTYDELIPKTERLARERFEAQGHAVTGDAADSAEIEIASIGAGVDNNEYKCCVRMQGRLVRNEQRFAAVDVVKERCEKTELRGKRDGDVVAFTRIVQALVGARDPDDAGILKLYESSVEELIDALSRQATRPGT